MKYVLLTTGAICTACSLLAYQFVGAANPLYETTTSDRTLAMAGFGILALLLFYCAWREHVKLRQAKTTALHVYDMAQKNWPE